MPTRLFLRGGTAANPPTAGEKSTALPVGTFKGNSGAGFEDLRLETAKGAAQTSKVLSSLAQTADQDNYIARFTSPALAAQTLSAETWTLAIAVSEANTNANSFFVGSIYIWRPSTSAVVGFIYDSHTSVGVEWVTTEDGQVLSLAGSAVTTLENDVLVIEIWRHAVQGMAAAYNQTVYFDGTTDVTDATTTDAASYLEKPTVITFPQGVTAVLVTDSGSGVDAILVGKQFFIADSGSGSDSILRGKSFALSEAGSSSEAVAVVQNKLIIDSGLGSETILKGVNAIIIDSGIGSDVLVLGKNIILLDSGSGLEDIDVVKPAGVGYSVTHGYQSHGFEWERLISQKSSIAEIARIKVLKRSKLSDKLPITVKISKIIKNGFSVLVACYEDIDSIHNIAVMTRKSLNMPDIGVRNRTSLIILYEPNIAVKIKGIIDLSNEILVKIFYNINESNDIKVLIKRNIAYPIDVITPKTLAELINMVEATDKSREGKLRSKSTVNHMRTKTTQETMRIQEEAQNKLTRIAKEIERMIEDSKTLEEIKDEFKEEVGTIISTAIRDVYFLGFHFVEEFAVRSLELKAEQIQAMNDMIEEALNEVWKGIQKFINKQLSEVGKTPEGLEIKILTSDALFDIGSIFAFITNTFTQQALNESTLTTILTLQIENEEEIGMIWITERDERVCIRCQNLDGQSKKPGELFHDDIGGIDVEHPPLHGHCRCRLLPLDGELVFNA